MSVKFSADASDAFSHLLMVGLASILEDDDTARCCRFRWLDTLRKYFLFDYQRNVSLI